MRKPTVRIALFLALGASMPFGCARSLPNSPTPDASRYSTNDRPQFAGLAVQGAYFPLAIGNQWTQSAEIHIQTISNNGTVLDDETFRSEIKVRLTGTEVRNGRPYVIEEDVITESGRADTIMNWIRYRQDASGLYEADVAASTPPGSDGREAPASLANPFAPQPRLSSIATDRERAAYQAAWTKLRERIGQLRALIHSSPAGTGANGPPGGILSGEITRLQYPVRPGATWVIRSDPFFQSTVEALEPVTVPAGTFPSCRIRIDSEFTHEGEWVRLWMSRSGEVAEGYHLGGVATDIDGNPIGLVIADYDLKMESVSLVNP